MPVPEFIRPSSIENMTEAQYKTLLEHIRERRMVMKRIESNRTTDKLRAPKNVKEKVIKQYDMLAKEIAQLDKIVEKLDKRWQSILSLRVELGGIAEFESYPRMPDPVETANEQ